MKKIFLLLMSLICCMELAAREQQKKDPCDYWMHPTDFKLYWQGNLLCCNQYAYQCVFPFRRKYPSHTSWEHTIYIDMEENADTLNLEQKYRSLTYKTDFTPDKFVFCPNKNAILIFDPRIPLEHKFPRKHNLIVHTQNETLYVYFVFSPHEKQSVINFFCQLNPHALFSNQDILTLKKDFPNIFGSSKDNKAKTSSAPDKESPQKKTQQPARNAWIVLGNYFYPADAPENLSNMRRFETKNKTKEIKINFSSKDKQPFLEKLKAAHRYHPARQIDCAGGNILYEAVSNGIYQAYILSENAITVFSAAYSLPTLPEEPHAARMQQEFCGLDINSKW